MSAKQQGERCIFSSGSSGEAPSSTGDGQNPAFSIVQNGVSGLGFTVEGSSKVYYPEFKDLGTPKTFLVQRHQDPPPRLPL